jgi:pimeloyl-ACP methyl ester carboxylesterase
MRRSLPLAMLSLAAAGAGAVGAYVLERSLVGRWQVGPKALAKAGLLMPADVEHHFVTATDGGRLHLVEMGNGPPVVLVHGITLGVGIWVRQFRSLAARHRVLALDQRGHGQSIAGTDGYSFDRLADDVLEVLADRDVAHAVVVGHSLGGMVMQVAALRRPAELARRVSGLALVATDAGPVVPGPLGRPVGRVSARVAARIARLAGHRGKGVYPGSDLATWGTRLSFGARPRPADVELVRSISSAASPRAVAKLLPELVAFDTRSELGRIELPTLIVVGTRDLLTPSRRARAMADCIPGARLELLADCGHLVMLERAEVLNGLLERFAAELVPSR